MKICDEDIQMIQRDNVEGLKEKQFFQKLNIDGVYDAIYTCAAYKSKNTLVCILNEIDKPIMTVLRKYITGEGVFLHVDFMSIQRIMRMACSDTFNAARDNKLDELKGFVGYGADPFFDNNLPLRIACGNGHLDIVKYLIELGADIHMCCDGAVRLASKQGQLEVVKYLVGKGAQELKDAQALAEKYEHPEVVEYLKSIQ